MQDMKQQKLKQNWTQEEDDILREQIGIHGNENWAIIAPNFKDKTTRQCKRRWYTYLNSDFKKGGWSAEEDRLLCESQKAYGNKWTEIAKVVPGRTNNAVKNRFWALCRKREKLAALEKENNISSSYENNNQKAYIYTSETYESAVPAKKIRRAHIPNGAEKINYADRLHLKNRTPIDLKARAPLPSLDQNSLCVTNLPAQDYKIERTFLKKDDPKLSVLMQQAVLPSSVAQNVDKENIDQSYENEWKVLKEFRNQTIESDILKHKIPDLQLEDLKDMVKGLKNGNRGGQSCQRKSDLYKDSPGSSKYSTRSTLLPQAVVENMENSML